MPASPTAPGISIVELPSSVRPVVGVSTSVAAFVDVFARGPVNQAVKVSGPGDVDRAFGGLFAPSEASYAIRQFFVNGGSQAWVVRVAPTTATLAQVGLPTDAGAPLPLEAASVGSWANDLVVGVQWPSDDVAPASGDTFDLVIGETTTTGGRPVVAVREAFRNLSTHRDSPRWVGAALINSSLLRLSADGTPGGRPLPTTPPVPGGTGGTSGATSGATSGGTSGVVVPSSNTGADLASSRDPARFLAVTPGSDGLDPVDDHFDPVDLAELTIGAQASLTGPTGLWCLDTIAPDVFNILCLPALSRLDPDDQQAWLAQATDFCERRRAMFLVDPPASQDEALTTQALGDQMAAFVASLDRSANVATYFPRLVMADPLAEGRPRAVGPSGTVAGIYARIDAGRGVWKAPAGTEAGVRGATPFLPPTEELSSRFNPLGVNVIRTFPVFSTVVWGARTGDGSDLAASQWKYIPVRRLALFIEESLRQSLNWVVFEGNDEPLWSQIRLNVGSFMQRLFRQGAFAGSTPREAYLVRCDADTTTADDVARGFVNILVGFQPLLPCEFVVISIQQLARPQEV